MTEWIESFGLTWTQVGWGIALWVVLIVGTIALVTFFVVRIPDDYFNDAHAQPPSESGNSIQYSLLKRIVRNILGYILIVAGAIMAIPGVPGQGILTMVIGIMLIDFPGKRRYERKLIGRPLILKAFNRIRARFKKPPLDLG